MLPRPNNDRAIAPMGRWALAALLLASICWVQTAAGDSPSISEDHLFRPVDFNSYDVMQPAAEDSLLPGQPYQDFTVQPPQRTFPNCRLPLLSWRVGLELPLESREVSMWSERTKVRSTIAEETKTCGR